MGLNCKAKDSEESDSIYFSVVACDLQKETSVFGMNNNNARTSIKFFIVQKISSKQLRYFNQVCCVCAAVATPALGLSPTLRLRFTL